MKKSDAILRYAKDCYQKVRDIEYPEGFLVNKFWTETQRRIGEAIVCFKYRKSAILWCQKAINTRFDHRSAKGRSLVCSKVRELERLFPGFYLKEHD